MLNDSTHRWLAWLPNLLTVARLALAVYFPFAPSSVRASIVILAAFSDFADGAIARRYGITSWIGGLLDGLADKAFVVAVMFVFVLEDRLASWQVVVLLARDLSVLLIVLFVVVLRHWDAFPQMTARLPGKITTAALFALMLLLSFTQSASWTITGLWAITGIFSIAAGADYLLRFVRCYRDQRLTRR